VTDHQGRPDTLLLEGGWGLSYGVYVVGGFTACNMCTLVTLAGWAALLALRGTLVELGPAGGADRRCCLPAGGITRQIAIGA